MRRYAGPALGLLLALGVLFALAVSRPNGAGIAAGPALPTPELSACATEVRLAMIGDYGKAGQAEADVAALVASWQPDAIVTAGDNNYDVGAAETIDANIGQYYRSFIAPYKGMFGSGGEENRFFPALGNHDWYTDQAAAYFDYFTLPGNERYYDVVLGPVHLFVLDSDFNEPDGITADSLQGAWLRAGLAASDAPWQVVVFHHAPYTSSERGPVEHMRWPFAAWGADVVLAGHDHFYERLEVDGIPYLINGAGGQSLYAFAEPVPESVARYNGDFGALLVEAGPDCLDMRFYTRAGLWIDGVTLDSEP